jgi:hypothetical protein
VVAATFVVAGFVKGVTGMGLPTVAMAVPGTLMLPGKAAALVLYLSARPRHSIDRARIRLKDVAAADSEGGDRVAHYSRYARRARGARERGRADRAAA